MMPVCMVNMLAAQLQLLRIEAPGAAKAAYSRVWISVKYPRVSGRHGPTAGISTTCPAHKRPSRPAAIAGAHVRAANASSEVEGESSTVAIGQVMAAQANFVRVKVESVEGGSPSAAPPRMRLLCVVRGLLKKIKQSVLVGDQVRVVGIDWTDGRGMVEEVLPRRSELSDPSVANVDHVVLVFSAAAPPFQPSQVTRYLVSAEEAGLPVTLLVNKADLVPPQDMQCIVEQVAGWGYDAIPISVVTGEGLPGLAARLQGRVSVVAGPSGAGKSSIINALRMRSAGMEGSLEAMHAEPTRGGGGGGGSWQPADEDGEEAVGDGSSSDGEEGHNTGSRERRDASSAGSGPVAGSPAASQHSGAPPGGGTRWEGAQPWGASSAQASSSTATVDREQVYQEEGEEGREVAAAALEGLEGLELQAVGDVSHRIGRGKHTTRNVTLLELGEGGLLADTPGFNQPVLGVPPSELWEAFPEIRQRLQEQRCAFANCQHLAEPGCAVRGEWERYPFYVELHAELTRLDEVDRERAGSKRKREGTVRYKSRAGGKQGAEARLESKSHRRVSRRSAKQNLSELSKGMDDGDL